MYCNFNMGSTVNIDSSDRNPHLKTVSDAETYSKGCVPFCPLINDGKSSVQCCHAGDTACNYGSGAYKNPVCKNNPVVNCIPNSFFNFGTCQCECLPGRFDLAFKEEKVHKLWLRLKIFDFKDTSFRFSSLTSAKK
jgi:hypothetical protein